MQPGAAREVGNPEGHLLGLFLEGHQDQGLEAGSQRTGFRARWADERGALAGPRPGSAHLSRCSAGRRRQRVLMRLRVSRAANWRICEEEPESGRGRAGGQVGAGAEGACSGPLGRETHLRVGRRHQQVAERGQGGRVPERDLELLGGLGRGTVSGESAPGRPASSRPARPSPWPVPGGCARCPAAATPAGSAPGRWAPWQRPSSRYGGRRGGGAARGGSSPLPAEGAFPARPRCRATRERPRSERSAPTPPLPPGACYMIRRRGGNPAPVTLVPPRLGLRLSLPPRLPAFSTPNPPTPGSNFSPFFFSWIHLFCA